MFKIPLLVASGALCYSALAPALGLGEITLHSALNQPLNAEIALVEPGDLADGELSVSLATAGEFSRAGVERVSFLNDLRFTPILSGNRSVIRVVSNKPVSEPFLNFLVQVNQPNGRLLREYTVLIDPPGSPGIVPSSERLAVGQNLLLPDTAVLAKSLEAAKDAQSTAVAPAQEQPPSTSEQLAASVLENQHLQTTIDDQQTGLQGQDEQIAANQKEVIDLQTQLAEVKRLSASFAAPATPTVANSPTVALQAEKPGGPNLLVMAGLLVLSVLLMLAFWVRRQRHQAQATPESSPMEPVVRESLVNRVVLRVLEKADDGPNSEAAAQNTPVPRRVPTAPPALAESQAKASGSPVLDEFQLNLDDLSMDSDWDLISPFETAPPYLNKPVTETPPSLAPGFTSNLKELPEIFEMSDEQFLSDFNEPASDLPSTSEIEALDEAFLDSFANAQTCIEEGDLDNASRLFNELLEDGDEPLQQTARNLLASTR